MKGKVRLYNMKFKEKTEFGRRIKVISLCLSLTAVCTMFFSCTGGIGSENPAVTDNRDPVTDTSVEETSANYVENIVRSRTAEDSAKALDSIADADFDGAATVIATCNYEDILCPSESSDEISATALARNKYIEEKFNKSLVSKKSASESELFEEVRKNKASGTYYADLLSVNVTEVGTYADAGLLMNLYSLPGADFFSYDYFNTEAMSQMRAAYKLYAVSGDATKDIRQYYAVFFNRPLAEELGMGSLYNLVYSGDWTWDKFAELMQAAAAARGTDSATEIGAMTDLSVSSVADAVMASAGIHYVDTVYGSVPSLSENQDAILDVISLCRRTISGGSGFESCFGTDASAVSSFRAGNILFYVGKLGDAELLASSETEWGVLPLPAYSADTVGITASDPSHTAVLVTTIDNALASNTSLIIQALNAASSGCMEDAAIEYIQNTAIRDNSSISMLRYIAGKTAGVDFTHVFCNLETLVSATRDAFYSGVDGASYTSYYNRYKNTAANLLKREFPLTNAA